MSPLPLLDQLIPDHFLCWVALIGLTVLAWHQYWTIKWIELLIELNDLDEVVGDD